MEKVPMVLVVDDDTLVRISLAAYLEGHGFALREAANAEDGLKMVRDQAVTVAIVDLKLSDSSGEDFILAAHAIRPPTRFILYTGAMEYVLPDRLRAIGMTDADVMPKPLPDMTMIVKRIERLAASGN